MVTQYMYDTLGNVWVAIRYIDHTAPDGYAPAFSAPMMGSVSTACLFIGVASTQAMRT